MLCSSAHLRVDIWLASALASVKTVAVNGFERVSVQDPLSVLLGRNPDMRLLSHGNFIIGGEGEVPYCFPQWPPTFLPTFSFAFGPSAFVSHWHLL